MFITIKSEGYIFKIYEYYYLRSMILNIYFVQKENKWKVDMHEDR